MEPMDPCDYSTFVNENEMCVGYVLLFFLSFGFVLVQVKLKRGRGKGDGVRRIETVQWDID